jgi:Flp pilus assembly pilin Flp
MKVVLANFVGGLLIGSRLRAASGQRPRTTPGWVRRLVTEDQGQDLVEYALLAGFIGITSVATWIAIESSLATAYTRYDNRVQGLWVPPPPSGR